MRRTLIFIAIVVVAALLNFPLGAIIAPVCFGCVITAALTIVVGATGLAEKLVGAFLGLAVAGALYEGFAVAIRGAASDAKGNLGVWLAGVGTGLPGTGSVATLAAVVCGVALIVLALWVLGAVALHRLRERVKGLLFAHPTPPRYRSRKRADPVVPSFVELPEPETTPFDLFGTGRDRRGR